MARAATPPSPWMKLPEAAAYLGVGVTTVERWWADPESGFPAVQIGGEKSVVRVHRDDLDAWVKGHGTGKRGASAAAGRQPSEAAQSQARVVAFRKRHADEIQDGRSRSGKSRPQARRAGSGGATRTTRAART